MTMAVDETVVMAEPETQTQPESPHVDKKPIKQNYNDTDTFLSSDDDQTSPRTVFEIPITDSNSSSTVFDDNNNEKLDQDQEKTTSIIFTTPPPPPTDDESKSSSIHKGGSLNSFSSSSSSESNSNNSSFRGLMDSMRKNSSMSVRRFSASTLALLASIDLSKRIPNSRNNSKRLSRASSASTTHEEEEEEDGDIVYSSGGVLPPGAAYKPSWRNFRYSELASASDNFSPERLLGKGGHAEVYEGTLSDGTVVAIKKLMKKKEAGDKEEDERVADFLSELGIIAHVNHSNTAKLIGFGVEKGLFIVLQHCPRGSLASQLHGSREGLKWNLRYKVAIGVAKGLSFLHHGCHRRIIHRDIKASNILLSEDFEPLISDFGLAKWLPNNWVHHVVHPIEGTFGYLAPEYFMHGIVHEKTDVFAFGVLLLELLTGRHAVDSSRQSLVMWAKPLLDANSMEKLVDPLLGSEDEYDESEVRRVMVTASMCIHHEAAERPYMKRVVELLEGEGEGEVKPKLVSVRSMLIDACDREDYTCSKYLKDLNRHRQLVME